MCLYTNPFHPALQEVSDRDLATIARDHIHNWESLRPYLGLNHAQKEEIRRSCPGDYGRQKQECLEVWKETKGNEATYQALITAAEEAKEQTLADDIRAMLIRQQNIPPPYTEGLYMWQISVCIIKTDHSKIIFFALCFIKHIHSTCTHVVH